MSLNFYKYQGTGNDFIICTDDDFNEEMRDNITFISSLCNRRFGIGADGLIVLEKKGRSDFFMHYFNSDGHKSSLCGNGSRCAVAHAHHLGWIDEECIFEAADGTHQAKIDKKQGLIKINMSNVYQIKTNSNAYILDTGSPHYVVFVNRLENLDVKESGRKIRYSDEFMLRGINVNFVKENTEGLEVCTYERGVEDETLSCGTGVTAAAVALAFKNKLKGKNKIIIQTKGGELYVEFERAEDLFCNIWLSGPAERIFKGELQIPVRA